MYVVYVFLSAHTCVNLGHTWCPLRPEETAGPLELQLQTVTSCHVDAGNQTLVLWKSSQHS